MQKYLEEINTEKKKKKKVANQPVIANKNFLQAICTSENIRGTQQFVSLPLKLSLSRMMMFWHVSQKKVFVLQCYVKSFSIKPTD